MLPHYLVKHKERFIVEQEWLSRALRAPSHSTMKNSPVVEYGEKQLLLTAAALLLTLGYLDNQEISVD